MTAMIPRGTKRTATGGLVAALFSLLVAATFAQEVKSAPELTAAQKERLKERDKLGERARQLRATGKVDEAMAAAVAKLAIEREVLGTGSEDEIGSLELIATLHEQRDDWAFAVKVLSEVQDLRVKALGAEHWKAVDARFAVERAQTLAALQPAQRRAFLEVYRLGTQIPALYGRGQYKEAEGIARRVLEQRKQVLGERHPDTINMMGDLAVMLNAQGDRAAARPLSERALELRKEVLGERHPSTITSMDNLAQLLSAQGDYAAARPLSERAVELYKQVLGERHPDTLTSMNNLAALLESQGDYAAARPLLERALALQKEVLGERHPDTIRTMNNLATLLNARGQYAAARPLFERALELRKEVLGERHPETINSMNNLAELLQNEGDYAAARPLSERALELRKEVQGERHPDTLRSMNNLAALLKDQGDYAAARSLFERVLVVRKQVLGENHPDTINSMNNLALALIVQGDYAAARPLLERAVEVRKQALGERNPDTLISMGNLASLLEDQGDHTAARPLFERVLELRKQVLGERHPSTLTSMNNLAALFYHQGDYAAARPLYEHALELQKQVLGERHPSTLTSMTNLAALFSAQGDYAAARPLYERALELRKQTLGERHPETIASMNHLAVALEAQGDYPAARPLYERVLDLRNQVLAERHPETIPSMNELAVVLQAIDEPQAARRLVAQALDSTAPDLNSIFPSPTESEQLAFLKSTGFAFQLALSLSAGEVAQDETIYQILLAQKGLATQAAVARRRAAALPQMQAQRDQIAKLRKQLNRLTYSRVTPEQADEHARQLRALSDRLGGLESELARAVGWQSQAPDPKQAAAALPEGAALVDWYRYTYFPGPQPGRRRPPREFRYVAFVVRPGQPVRRIELGPAGPIDEEIAALRARLHLASGTLDDVAGRLARLAWKPLVPYLASAQTVLIAPDADMCFVPWGALPDLDKPATYLLRRFAFGVIGSVRELIALKNATNEPVRTGLLAVGGVDYEAAGKSPVRENKNAPVLANRSRSVAVDRAALTFGQLPGTGEEARAVAALFDRSHPGSSAKILSGSEAAEPSVGAEMAGRRYLHLATHGYFAAPELRNALAPVDNTVGPRSWEGMGRREVGGYYPGLLSGLVWAGASVPSRDPITGLVDVGAGLMTAEEVSGLDLSGCELAVLSACETGLGRTAGGEGVLGLQRGFHHAGCRTVVASLWKVDDEATRVLMERFYTNLWQKKVPVLEALRQAQLSVLDDPAYGAGGNPRLWAAWVLSGDTGGWLSRVKSPSGANGGPPQ